MERKIRERLIALGLLLSMSINLSACGAEKKKRINTNRGYSSYSSEPIINATISDEAKNANIVDNALYCLNQISGEYPYEDLCLSQEEIGRLIEESKEITSCPNTIQDLDSEIAALMRQLEDNTRNLVESEDFKKNYPNCTSVFSPSIAEQEYLDMPNLIERVLREIFSKATNNVAEDFCFLNDISIVVSFEESGIALGEFLPDERLLIIYINDIKDVSYDLDEELFNTIAHELDHARQIKCEHRQDEPGCVDINYDENFVSTIIETSAESALYNLEIVPKDIEDNYNYYSERVDEVLFFLIGITNPSIDDYYNAIFDSDVAKLYQFLGLKNNEDIATFYRILYVIDSRNVRTDLIDNAFDKELITYGELYDFIGYGYYVDTFKLTLKNLVDYTYKNSDFTLEDNLDLFTIIRDYIVTKTCDFEKQGEDYVKVYDPVLAQSVYDLENMYVKFLSDFYEVPIEEIRRMEKENSDLYVKIERLKNKFPILDAISYMHFFYTDYYDEFLKNNGFMLKRERLSNN